ncbi:MAG: polyphosphate glucokinase, partial [Ilumatobacteraceae bacterium]|nr:polyphosphate glucokinase [Ilumatobacteraceae bacterium]
FDRQWDHTPLRISNNDAMQNERLGIDIGGTGIKGAPVDVRGGKLLAERFRIDTPQPATPEAVADTVGEIAKHFDWKGPIGATMPGVVKNGVILTAANIDKSWIGTDAATLFAKATGCSPVMVLNDADAAGIAEMQFGAGKGRKGVVVMVTLGTGIGFALFHDGVLMPNTELGHLEMNGKDAEDQASARVRDENDESWKKWAKKVDEYLDHVDALLWPDLIIIGGGVSKKADKFFPHLTTRAELVAAKFENEAGIVGAALAMGL